LDRIWNVQEHSPVDKRFSLLRAAKMMGQDQRLFPMSGTKQKNRPPFQAPVAGMHAPELFSMFDQKLQVGAAPATKTRTIF
jgi:hypothetical protein